MKTVNNKSLRVITLLIMLCSLPGAGLAVEAPGSPFSYEIGSSSTLRTYSGTVVAGQSTLVAFERDVWYASPSCAARDWSVADLTTAIALGTQPLNGTVSFTTAANQALDATEDDGMGCTGPLYEAGAIYYIADATYSGADSFQLVLPNSGDNITVNITVTAAPSLETEEPGGLAIITPQLLQTSIKQTTTMISSRIKRLIIPKIFVENEQATIQEPNAPIITAGGKFKPESTHVLTPAKQKHPISKIIHVSVNKETIGLSAGDASMKHGFWTNIAYTATNDDNSITESTMDINTYIMGYDYKFSDRMAIGVAVTYEQINADLAFNNGKVDGDGYTVAPYFVMLLTDYLTMDIIAGYAIIDYDQDRDFGLVDSSVDADRQFVEFSLVGFHYIDQWNFTGHLSFIYAHEGQDSYRESDGTRIKANNVDFSQFSAGVEVAYTFKHVEPYLTLTFEHDSQYEEINDTSYDRSGGDGGFGCRFFFTDQLSADLYGSTKFGRENFDEYSILGNMRYIF